MTNELTSNYSEIIVDAHENSPVGSVIHPLTIEEYHDLMHHSHNEFDVLQDIEILLGGVGASENAIIELKMQVKALQNLVLDMQDKLAEIDSLKEIVSEHDGMFAEFESVKAAANRVSALEENTIREVPIDTKID